MRKLFSIEAEHSVIGSMIKDNDCIDDVASEIKASDFATHENQLIFNQIISMRSENKPIDAVTLIEAMEGVLGSATDYIVDLVRSTPSSRNVMTYAGIVKSRARERMIFSAADSILGLQNEEELNTKELVDAASKLFSESIETDDNKTQVTINESAKAVVQNLDDRLNGKTDINHIKTGLTEVDNRIEGFRPGDLVIVGARPAMGKTTYAMGIAKHAAERHGAAMVFSLEMPHEQLTERLMASHSGIDLADLRNPKQAGRDFWALVASSATHVKDLPIFIDDQAGISVLDLQIRARRQHRKTPLTGGIYVDYIQLLSSGVKSENRTQEISSISRALKNLAKDLKVPVIALSQLSRDLEKRPDKRPLMSDLRESGAIEQDADIIQFLYRDEVYNPETDRKGVSEIITAKFRNGVIGKDFVGFQGRYSRFTNIAYDEYADQNQQSGGKFTY